MPLRRAKSKAPFSLNAVIEEHIDYVMWLASDNKSRAARYLGVNRRTLQRWEARIQKNRKSRRKKH